MSLFSKFIALTMQVVGTCETSVKICTTTRRSIPEYTRLSTDYCCSWAHSAEGTDMFNILQYYHYLKDNENYERGKIPARLFI
jgi:hypothetical protein